MENNVFEKMMQNLIDRAVDHEPTETEMCMMLFLTQHDYDDMTDAIIKAFLVGRFSKETN